MSRNRKRKIRGPANPSAKREELYKPHGPGISLISEGERESRHYRNVGNHPLDLAYERGKITKEMWDAGTYYSDLFEKRARSGLDSSQMIDRSHGSGASPIPYAQCQADAIMQIDKIEGFLKPNDATIVRMFCGEGHKMTTAVQSITCFAIGPKVPSNAVVFRVREALDSLEDAIRCARIRKAA